MSLDRPRLAEHVVARLHRRGGVERLVLLDARADRVVELDARAWSVLGCADGTRDVRGVVAAASRYGVEVSVDEVVALFGELARLDWLTEGAPSGLVEGAVDPPHKGDHRWVRELTDARYRCDGRGACCRSYATISLTPADVHRAAVALVDDHALQDRSHAVLLPIVGSAPTVMRAVALVDGGCRFLEDDGACRIHRHAGMEAKPTGCQWFPTQLVDDGEEVRGAPALECVCVAQPDAGAAPLFDPIRVSALPLGLSVRRVPAVVAAGTRRLERHEAVALVDGLLDPDAGDAPGQLWSLAGALAGEGSTIDTVAIAERFAAVGRRASVRADVEATWRGEADLVVARLRTIAMAAALLAAPTTLAVVMTSDELDPVERHALRIARFLRAPLVTGDAARAAEAAALRMWLARAVAALVDPTTRDVTLRDTPLAAVSAAWRVERLGG